MSSGGEINDVIGDSQPLRASSEQIQEFALNALIAAGTQLEAAHSVANALTETSMRGVDNHGIRLLPHYIRVVQGGRINPNPKLTFNRTGPATGIVDGDDGFGHHASYFVAPLEYNYPRRRELEARHFFATVMRKGRLTRWRDCVG